MRVVPRNGHTDSDVSLELDDPSIVFCGDLFWNAMFPNFVDAMPTKLVASVARSAQRDTLYMPGHGPIGHADRIRSLHRRCSKRSSARRGKRMPPERPPPDAGASFTLPSSLGDWTLFNNVFYQRAFEAWYKELKA